MITIIEQLIRYPILFLTFVSTVMLISTFKENSWDNFNYEGKVILSAYLISNIGIFLHAGWNLWIYYEKYGTLLW